MADHHEGVHGIAHSEHRSILAKARQEAATARAADDWFFELGSRLAQGTGHREDHALMTRKSRMTCDLLSTPQ
jgi:hypothetical protein